MDRPGAGLLRSILLAIPSNQPALGGIINRKYEFTIPGLYVQFYEICEDGTEDFALKPIYVSAGFSSL